MNNLKELVDKTDESINFEFGENDEGRYVNASVPPDISSEFKAGKKQHMEFFARLGELIAEADQEEHNAQYADQQVEGSLFDAIKNRKESQDVA